MQAWKQKEVDTLMPNSEICQKLSPLINHPKNKTQLPTPTIQHSTDKTWHKVNPGVVSVFGVALVCGIVDWLGNFGTHVEDLSIYKMH